MVAKFRALTTCALLLVLLGPPARAHDRHFALLGNDAGENFGRGLSGIGDVDGDGFDDLVVGIHRDGTNGANAGSARVYSGLTGQVLREWFGDGPDDRFGIAVAGVGDVDGDGRGDVLVGAHQAGVGPGYARLFSGASGLEIDTLVGENDFDTFGEWVAPGGDVDSDGIPDLVVGADDYDNDRGAVYVFSGATRALVRAFTGDAQGDAFGVEACGIGDVNLDGFGDVIVGAYLDDDNGPQSGRATVFSGRTGNVLYAKDGATANDRFGISVNAAGDVDDDGYPDFVVGAATADGAGTNAGSATVFSGFDGSVLHLFEGDVESWMGISVASAGDLDGDGHDDVLVGAFRDDAAGLDAGRLFAFSGHDGSVLLDAAGEAPGDAFGRHGRAVGDVNGDGIPDLAVSAPDSAAAAADAGFVHVLSYADRPFVSDRHEFSLANGDVQTLDLRAGAEHAFRFHWVLGSATGVAPPITGGGVILPLAFDSFTVFTLRFPNSAVLSGSVGFLDANGDATMAFDLPPGADPSLQGVTFFWAYVVHDEQRKPAFASDPLPVTLVE